MLRKTLQEYRKFFREADSTPDRVVIFHLGIFVVLILALGVVQMIAHDTPAMQQHSFFLLAKTDTVKHNITVIFPGKNIHPFHHGKGYKMNGCLVPDFVTTITHKTFLKIIALTAFSKADD